MSDVDATRISTPSPDTLVASDRPSHLSAPPTIPDVALERQIGAGGMGVVWRGRQTWIDRPVAVKFLLNATNTHGDSEWQRRFQREAQLLAKLSHPHIVGCYQAGVAAGVPFLVMEFIDGPDLASWITKNGPLAPADALRVVAETARALHYAYQAGIIHRDVKSANILLASGGGSLAFPYTAKLADLGLAKPEQRDRQSPALTRAGAVVGTPQAMAPEQFDDPDGVDYRADIYALGCLLYHALTGRDAYSGQTLTQIVTSKTSGTTPDPRHVVPRLNDDIVRFTRHLLERDRTRRPQQYEDIWTTCDKLMSTANRPTARRTPWWLIGGGTAVLAASLIVALSARSTSSPDTVRPTPAHDNTTTTTAPSAPILTPAPRAPAATGPLWDAEFNQRLAGWKIFSNGDWSATETMDDAIVATRGGCLRSLPAGAAALGGTMHLTLTGRSSRMGAIGLVLADGSTVSLTAKNLDSMLVLSLETATALEDQWRTVVTKTSAAQADLALELAWQDGRLRARIAGQSLALPLTAEPRQLFVRADGPGPVTISGLRLIAP